MREFETIIIPDDDEETAVTSGTLESSSSPTTPSLVLSTPASSHDTSCCLDNETPGTSTAGISTAGNGVTQADSTVVATVASEEPKTPCALTTPAITSVGDSPEQDYIFLTPFVLTTGEDPVAAPAPSTLPLLLDDVPCLHPVTGEQMTDFEWLGAISDYYDEMARKEKKSASKPPVTVAARREVSYTDNEVPPPNQFVTEEPATEELTVESVRSPEPASTSGESTGQAGRRINPDRAAKQGVSYTEQLADTAPLAEYCKFVSLDRTFTMNSPIPPCLFPNPIACTVRSYPYSFLWLYLLELIGIFTCNCIMFITDCWQCDKGVVGECDVHGGLVPCSENITARGRKDPTKFPVPSFVRLDKSTIPQGGFGAFATEFIPPGLIIGF